jgi:hypothetical protein
MFRYAWRRFKFGAIASALILGGGYALAQTGSLGTTVLTTLTGNEIISVAGTGPQIQSVTINQIRNATGYLLVGAGTTVATQLTNSNDNVIATGAITTWNVNLPTAPGDGQQVNIACSGGTASTLNVAATLPAGVTIVGTANPTCTSGGATGAEYTYTASGNIWFRIR